MAVLVLLVLAEAERFAQAPVRLRAVNREHPGSHTRTHSLSDASQLAPRCWSLSVSAASLSLCLFCLTLSPWSLGLAGGIWYLLHVFAPLVSVPLFSHTMPAPP